MKINYREMRTDDFATERYYMLKWISNIYTAQDDIVMKGYNPPEYEYAGDMVCEARFWKPVIKAKHWYTPMLEGESDTTLRMK